MKIAGYTRFSTDRQGSTQAQRENVVRTLRRLGLPTDGVCWFGDEAMSGALIERPDYQKMRAAVRAREFDVIAVDSTSRLGRDAIERQTFERDARHFGVRVVAADGFDSAARGSRLMGGVKALFDQELRDAIAADVHRTAVEKITSGKTAGGRTYGYRSVPADGGRRLEVDPDTAPVVARIFREYGHEGRTCRQIAKRLTEAGVPNPRGGPTWSMTTVYAMLHNETYAGRLTWNRTRSERDPDTGRRTPVERPRSEWIVRDSPDLRIIDERTVLAVRGRQRESANEHATRQHRRGGPGRGPKHLCSGLLVCGACGGKMAVSDSYGYACSNRRNRPGSCDNKTKIARAPLEERVIHAVTEELFDPADLDSLERDIARSLASTTADAATALAGLRVQEKRLTRKIDRLLAAIEDGQPVAERLTERTAERADVRRRIADLDVPPAPVARVFATLRGHPLDELAELATSDVHAARRLLASVVGQIVAHPRDDAGHVVLEMRGQLIGLLRYADPAFAQWLLALKSTKRVPVSSQPSASASRTGRRPWVAKAPMAIAISPFTAAATSQGPIAAFAPPCRGDRAI